MTQPLKPIPPQPNIKLQRTRLAARLLAYLRDSNDFEWACGVLEEGGGGALIIKVGNDMRISAIGQESCRKVS